MHLEPIVSFAILLAVILIVPLCFERLKLPGLLGLLVAGVALGSHGLNLLSSESETMRLLSDIGLVYLLFVAGLEIDLEQFRATKHRSAGFGTMTFLIPLITGIVLGRLFGFDWNASVLIGSLLASHTLLAYPIISRLGVVSNEAVTVTIGATIFTDIGALLVLAVCLGIKQGDFSFLRLASLLLSLLIYSAVILFGFNWLGQEVFRRSGDEEGNQFLFVLLVVFISALGVELIGVEKIVGAFLAGLAVNSVVGHGPVKEKILFVGNVLFIPVFFINTGLIIDIPAFIKSITSFWLALAIVLSLLGSKFAAAALAKLVYRYSWREGLTMWSLSMPQVAATLAAAFVGYKAQILTEDVLNSIIVLMLVTSTLGPIITTRTAAGLTPSTSLEPDSPPVWEGEIEDEALTIVVPVYNPQTERNLIEMAALLARHESGRIVPLSVSTAHVHMDAPELGSAIDRSQTLLANATRLGREFGVEAKPLLRIDDSIAQGISRASREQHADLIIMGWGRTEGFRARLFGNVIDQVLWASHCPVAVTRLLESPSTIRHILVPIETITPQAVQMVRFAEILAGANQAAVTVLYVCDRYSSAARIAWVKSQLELLISRYVSYVTPEVSIVTADDVAGAIIEAATSVDLVVLRTVRNRSNTIGELAISDITNRVVKQLNCSVVTLGDPHRYPSALMLERGKSRQPTNTSAITDPSNSARSGFSDTSDVLDQSEIES
jgi:Kef-type K+ transport system membrane component KefB/nucleotide-binding universal stress UspA family protein